jgi:chromosome segregation ATPase
MLFKRLLPAIIFSVLLSSCGLVDTEAAGEAIAQKEEVLRIQTEQLDPLLDQLSRFQSQIEPFEQEIEDLEEQRDALVDQGRDLADEFEREMQDRFQMVYQDEDEARRTFGKQIEDEFDALSKEMRDLDRVYQVKWQELDVLTQAIFDEAEKEINAKRDELSSMPNSTPEMDALEEQFGQLRAADIALNQMRSGIQLAYMELEERSFDLEDQITPLYEQIEELYRKEQAVWEAESSVDYNFLREAAYDQIRNIQNDLQVAWESEEDASEVDWVQREQRRRAAEEQHSATLQNINSERSAAYVQSDQSDIGAAAEKGMSSLTDDYANSRTKYQNLIVELDAKIEEMGGGSESGQESANELRAKLESTRLQYQDVNDLLGTLDSIIRGGEESNPEFATAKQASDDAAVTLQSAQETLAATPAEIEGPADPDNPGADPVMIVHPDYLTAQTVVDDAQLAFDAAESVFTTTPETLVTEDKPNPAYETAKSQAANLQASVRALEQQQSSAPAEAPPVVNPEMTAAYADKSEYESILKDLENQYTLDSQALGDKVSAGGESINVSNVESDLESKVQQADQILRDQLALIDSEQLGSGDKSGTITELERQIKALEDQARALEKEEQIYHRTREMNGKDIRAQIRSLENEQIDPLRDAQKEIERERRPLRKQQMVIDREQMTMQDQWAALEEQRQPLEEARQEMQEVAWREMEKWERSRFDEADDQATQARNDLENERTTVQWELEDQMYALEDKRGDVEDAFYEERDTRIVELQEKQDSLREERMLPLEIEAQELDDQIAVKWEALDALYEAQRGLKDEISELEIVVRDLDRQAEFGVLSVIAGALSAAEEIEKSGGSSVAFESLLPDIGIGN